MKTRRTNRIKREKPNYYDALEYDKQSKKSAKVRYYLFNHISIYRKIIQNFNYLRLEKQQMLLVI